MNRYVSKPTVVEAVQWSGTLYDVARLREFAGDKIRFRGLPSELHILAGKDGAQGWVPVPIGHFLVSNPGDRSDIWPVEADVFWRKYEVDVFWRKHEVEQ